jgi:cytochrome c peroxidase
MRVQTVRSLGVVLVLSPAWALAEVPRAGPLAQPKATAQKGLAQAIYEQYLPHDNPQTPAKIALGQKLFFEGRISADGQTACATCHDPDKGFTDRRATSKGIHDQIGHRNAPTVLNAMFNETQFWDGRAANLEQQALLPILNPIEMGRKSGDEVVAALAAIPEYASAFQRAFGHAVTYADVGRAIAAYERAQVAFDSPFDRYLAGDENALDAGQKRGWALFNGRGRCVSCHGLSPTRPSFSDDKFHNIGVAAHKQNFATLAKKGLETLQRGSAEAVDRAALETDLSELGRFLVTKQAADIGAFKTSGLRNTMVTAPYFHDGSADTLWDVLDHYNKGGVQNPYLDGGIERLGLSEAEIDDLVAFLASLTSDKFAALGKSELARQRALSRSKRPSRDTAAAMGQNALGPGLRGPFGDPAPQLGAKDKNPSLIGGR